MVDIVFEARGLVRTLSGFVSLEEMDASAQKIQGHPLLDDMQYNIHDFTGVTGDDLEEDDIAFMAVRAALSVQRNPRLRIAFVGQHPVAHKLMNAFNDSGCTRHQVQRFDTLAEARRYAEGA